jgi:hypothetical protein
MTTVQLLPTWSAIHPSGQDKPLFFKIKETKKKGITPVK